MSDLPKPRPCPFCGGTEEDGTLHVSLFGFDRIYVRHNPTDPGCAVPSEALIRIERWNRRCEPPMPS